MSVVYRARDQQLARDVALKVLHAFLAKQPEARRRFHREAVAVAKLHHPGILEIFDYSGPDAEPAYIVTELIEGKTLRKFVEEHGAPRFPELGALVLAELTRALRHAHEQGVVHRDLKPENIMITTSGQLKLMDFGIAQIMGGATKLTATGTLLGSPAHMAPEVIDGKPSDHRSDIFSLGTILYWLCTGQLPFEAPTPSALFRRILEGSYDPPQMLEPKIGNGLARIIEKALAQDPDARYQDVSHLETDLFEELREVELEPPGHLTRQFLLDPRGFADGLEPKLIDRLAAAGETALAEQNVARAMDRFNRVLAIDPHHEKVKALSARIGKKERMVRRAKQAVAATGLLCAVGGAGWGAATIAGAEQTGRAAVDGAVPVTAAIVSKVEHRPERAHTASVGAAAAHPDSPIDPPPVTRAPPRSKGVARHVAPPPPPPPPPMPSDRVEPPPAEPIVGRLNVRIGSGFGDIHVDDQVFPGKVLREVTLPVGRHQVYVEKPRGGQAGVPGRYAPRIVEVDSTGRIFSIIDGARGPEVGELRFRVARDQKEIEENPDEFRGWTSY